MTIGNEPKKLDGLALGGEIPASPSPASSTPHPWRDVAPRRTPALALRLTGALLEAVGRLTEIAPVRALVRRGAEDVLGIRALRDLPVAYRGDLPDPTVPRRAREPSRWADAALGSSRPRDEGRLPSTDDYLAAYASGARDPRVVAERATKELVLLARRTPSMNVLAALDRDGAIAAAEVSARRWKEGRPRPLEGVPFTVKDQHDAIGLPTRFGARHEAPIADADATLVARLRAAGAILLGKTVMTEWGISPIGNSPHDTMPRNAHDPGRAAGGSSTGAAVAVALGIGPFASGADAGGSVRLPASFAGVFGIKPTFGRVSRAGEAFSGSMNHLGAIGLTTTDLVHFLDATSRDADPRDLATVDHGGSFGARLGDGVRGLRIGIEDREWADCDPSIARRCREALDALVADGAVLVPIRVPLASHAAAIGIATMAAEGSAFAATTPRERHDALALDVRLALKIAHEIPARDYLDVQRLRAGLRHQLAAALRTVHVIALPTVPIAPPKLTDAELGATFSDGALVARLCRFTFLANLAGLPAASAPVGRCGAGLPVGLQIVADAWDEAGLLAVLAHLERSGASRAIRPPRAAELLT